MLTITDEMVERALGAVTEELPEGVQYALIRGLKAMGWEIAITGSHDVMRAALTAALEGREDHFVDANEMVEPVAWQFQYRALHCDGSFSDWSDWADGRAPDYKSDSYQARERPLYAHPSSTDIARIRSEAVAGEQNGGDIK